MPTKQLMKQLFFIMLLSFFSMKSTLAHQPDLSTFMLYEKEDGKCYLQIYSSLGAFEGEIDYKFSKNSYKTPEEFKVLVGKHFLKNTLLILNQQDTLTLSNPQVILGHETKLLLEVSSFPKNIQSLYLSNKAFADTPNHQSIVMMLKKGLPNQQYILNKENQNEIHLIMENGKWQMGSLQKSSLNQSVIITAIAIVFLFLSVLGFRKWQKDKKLFAFLNKESIHFN